MRSAELCGPRQQFTATHAIKSFLTKDPTSRGNQGLARNGIGAVELVS